MHDEQLVEMCKKGEKQAFEELIGKYYLPLNKFFYKLLGNPETCEDLTHDVIVKLIRNIEKYRPVLGAKFSTWLFRIAYNTYIDYVKRPGARESAYDEAAGGMASGEDIHESVEKRIDRQFMRQCVNELPCEMKTLVILRYFGGFGYPEISEITGMSVKKVKWKLHSSLEKLKKNFDSRKGGANG